MKIRMVSKHGDCRNRQRCSYVLLGKFSAMVNILGGHHVVQQFPALSHQPGGCRRVQCHLTAYLVSDFPTG